ncbi:MAG: gamma-glutamylcyclotransferase family protein [Hyphomonadaceae bacterium]
MNRRLFVYGSLRSDAAGYPVAEQGAPWRARLSGAARRIGSGDVAGELYAVDWYPALVLNRGTRARVRGELWEMRAPDRLLAELDPYEGDDYARSEQLVRLDTGRTFSAWVWAWTVPLVGAPRIDSGDYCEWAASVGPAASST